jgi:hypothetical protein
MRWVPWLIFGISQLAVLIAGIGAISLLTATLDFVEEWLGFLWALAVVISDVLILVFLWPPTLGIEAALVLAAVITPFIYFMSDDTVDDGVRILDLFISVGLVTVGILFLLNVLSVPSGWHLAFQPQRPAISEPMHPAHGNTPSNESTVSPRVSSPASASPRVSSPATPSTPEAALPTSAPSNMPGPNAGTNWLALATALGVLLGGIGGLIGGLAAFRNRG